MNKQIKSEQIENVIEINFEMGGSGGRVGDIFDNIIEEDSLILRY